MALKQGKYYRIFHNMGELVVFVKKAHEEGFYTVIISGFEIIIPEDDFSSFKELSLVETVLRDIQN